MALGYAVQACRADQWVEILQESRAYCLGYLEARRTDLGPRVAYRVVRLRDGRVVAGFPAQEHASLGMVAGHPTAAQYRAAAERCAGLADAAQLREDRAAGVYRRPCPEGPQVGDLVTVVETNDAGDAADLPGKLGAISRIDDAPLEPLPWGLNIPGIGWRAWASKVRRPTPEELVAYQLAQGEP